MLEPDPELAVAYGIFSVRQARAAGYGRADVERHVRRGLWFRRGKGVLVASGRIVQRYDHLVLALLEAGPGAVIGFESAAALHGWDLRVQPTRPQLIIPLNRTGGGGYRSHLNREDVELWSVVPVSIPRRTALDVAASAPFDDAVVALDSGMRCQQLALADLTQLFDSSHRLGIAAARLALSSVDPRSGSVPETEARLLFARAGLPAPVTQYVIRDGHRFVARIDFGWEFALLAAEIDGFAYHSKGGDFQRDRSKQNEAQLTGWLVLRFTVADIRDRPDRVVAEIWRGLRRRRG